VAISRPDLRSYVFVSSGSAILSSEGILHVGLKYNAPCVFCVLTDDNIAQSRARSGGVHGNKGTEAAVAALKMLELKHSL
jgi:6,7-dimethyl-8-ribityllumazine synthase